MNKIAIGVVIVLVLIMTAVAALYHDSLGWRSETVRAPVYLQTGVYDKHRTVAIIGEFFRPTEVERWLMFRRDQPEARAQLIEMLKREGAGTLVFVGNMVGRGASAGEWRWFDQTIQHFLSSKIPVFPVLGEREYRGLDSVALTNLRARFSEHQNQSWFAINYLNLGFIFLDSNESQLARAEWNAQLDWYKSKLAQFDSAAGIDGVVVFLHHPPFTNGDGSRDSLRVKEDILPPFLESKKALIMTAGRTGAYEKFYENDKYFYVTGGGGGPRAVLKPVDDRARDLYVGSALRPFHYLLLQPVQGGVTVEVKGFDQGEPNIRQIEKSFIPFRSKDVLKTEE